MPFRRPFNISIAFKLGVGLGLALLAERLIFGHAPGTTVGVFALAWLVGTAATRPGLVREPRAAIALGLALLLALAMLDRPGFLGWLLFGVAITIAAMSARVRAGEPAWRWAQRLVVQGIVGIFGPLIDLRRLKKTRRGLQGPPPSRLLRLAALPLAGGIVFLWLFASANPIIADAVGRLRLPSVSFDTVARIVFCGLVFIMVGATLSPRWRRRLIALPSLEGRAVPGVNAGSVILSLWLFNALFALQNGLDLAFLWSGAPLPEGVTLADYAHRGAYPLIATALLAGAFVLIALRPGSETAERPLVRRLVMLWVAQNMLLVASSLLRTLDYVDAYALTRFRLAAMIWMVLVGVGLLLICWRLLRNRSAHWLIDANVVATLGVLAVVGVIDLGAVAAAWNVRHAREVDGTGAALDLCYLDRLGPSALVSLATLEHHATDPALRERVSAVRYRVQSGVLETQADWRSWRWRDARRLARVHALIGDAPAPARVWDRSCDGVIVTPPRPLAPVPGPPEIVPIPEPRPAVAGPAQLTPKTGD